MWLRLVKGTPPTEGHEVAAHLDAAIESLTKARLVPTALDVESDCALVSLITDLQHEAWTIRQCIELEGASSAAQPRK